MTVNTRQRGSRSAHHIMLFFTRRTNELVERRNHDRVDVEYSASFSGGGWFDAQGVILDLSATGCRVRSASAVKKDDCLGVLIDVPRYEHPLHVILATVRWSNGQEFGMEFMQMEQGDQSRLRELIRAIKAAGLGRTEDDDSTTRN